MHDVTRDKLAIPGSNAPVFVRMLRQATNFTRQESEVAKEPIARQTRADSSNAAGQPDSLVWFDADYLAEAYRQNLQPSGGRGATGSRARRRG